MVFRSAAFRRWVGAAVSLPLMVFAVSFTHDLMLCRYTGSVIESCACPDDPPAPRAPTVSDQGCCERQSIEAISLSREVSGGVLFSAPISVAVRVPTVVLEGPISHAVTARATFRPDGPPLVLVKQSFLI